MLVRKRTWVPQSCAGTYCPRLCLARASLAREIPGGYLSEEAALIEQAVASRWCVLQVAAQAGWLGHLCQVPLLFRCGVWQAKPGSPSATPKVEAGRCGVQAVGRGAPEDGAQNVEAHHAQEASADREGVLRREYQCHLRAPAAPQTRSCHDIRHDACCLRSQGQVGAVPLRRETAAHPDAEPRSANHMWMHCSLTPHFDLLESQMPPSASADVSARPAHCVLPLLHLGRQRQRPAITPNKQQRMPQLQVPKA